MTTQEELDAAARASLERLDVAMREARTAIDAAEGTPPRVVSGWVALWTTTRYDEEGRQFDGWNYSLGESTNVVQAVGVLGVAARSVERLVEGPPE